MPFRETIKAFAIRYNGLITVYRATFGKLKTKYYFGIQRKMLQKNGMKFVRKIGEALDAQNAKYFVDCGTLLGITRDKKLIAYDRDMDFGIYFDEQFTKERLDETMRALGLKKYREFYFRGEAREISYSNGVTAIDFFQHTEQGDTSRLYTFYRKPGEKYPSEKHYTVLEMWRKHILGLKRIKVNDVFVSVPENTEEYLESAYTENWTIPDPNWHYLMEPGLHEIEGEFGIRK